MKLLTLGLLLIGTTTMAADQTLLETPVTYADTASIVQKVKEECRIDEMLEKRVGDVLAKNNRGSGTIARGVELADGQILRLQIENVLGVGGGAYSGPKAITVAAEIFQNGKSVRKTQVNRWSMGGVFGGFKGTCSILDRCAVAIGKDLLQWTKDPNFVIKKQAEPKAEEAASAVEKL